MTILVGVRDLVTTPADTNDVFDTQTVVIEVIADPGNDLKNPGFSYVDANNDGLFDATDGDVPLARGWPFRDGQDGRGLHGGN